MTNTQIVQLLKQLVPYYESVLDKLKNSNFNEYYNIVHRTGTNCGICNCALLVFNIDIYKEDWPDFVATDTPGWYKGDIIPLFEYRIAKMKELILKLSK